MDDALESVGGEEFEWKEFRGKREELGKRAKLSGESQGN